MLTDTPLTLLEPYEKLAAWPIKHMRRMQGNTAKLLRWLRKLGIVGALTWLRWSISSSL